jgi:hypothetical protein
MIPTWLRRHLETAGRWNTDGIGRNLSSGTCRTCRARVVRGLDGDRCALPRTCDPQPVDAVGEALALVGGRATFTLTRATGQWRLDTRDEYRIAGRRLGVVLAEHQCHAPPLPTTPTTDPDPTPITGDPTW